MSRTSIALFILLAAAAAASCSSGGSKPMCGAPRDAGVVEVGIEAPPGCPPAPNELGIGKPCSMCGDECESPLHCTCDPYLGLQLEGVPCVCTKAQPAPTGSTDPCVDVGANFCGSNTTCCAVLNIAAYCVPNVCLLDGKCIVFVPADAGTDSAPDAAAD